MSPKVSPLLDLSLFFDADIRHSICFKTNLSVSVLSRQCFLRHFTVTGLACGGNEKRENNVHPNSSSGRKEQQKKVDGRAAAEIASKQKHCPAKEQLIASSRFSSLDSTTSSSCSLISCERGCN